MAEDVGFRVPLVERQLFLDDFGIAKVESLTRTMHQPSKKGAVIRPNVEKGEGSLQTRSAPAWDPEEKVFKLWLIGDLLGQGVSTYARSKDGLHWEKPILGQKEVDGSRDNNVISVEDHREWPDNGIENVVFDPQEKDFSRRYKGFLNCFGREPMVSPDGVHWKLLDVPKISSSDESNMSYDAATVTFIATVKRGGPHGRSVYLTTSTDFEHWTEPELIFHADDLDQELGKKNIEARLSDLTLQRPVRIDPSHYNVDVYNMGVFRYEGLYIGMPAMFHSTGPELNNRDGFHLIQLICSRDLKNWNRLGDRKAFIPPSPVGAGAYDLTQILGPSCPILRNDELWFYYTGIKYRVAPETPDADGGAICLAVLRRDGFISLDAEDKEGAVLTKQFALPGERLHVNANAGKGELQVEALDENGKLIASSLPVTGDVMKEEVQWQETGLSGLRGKAVSLRFRLKNAKFYSYWLEE